MIVVRQTDVFVTWLARLRDMKARIRIIARIRRLESGNAGDWKSVGDGVNEMRIDWGPGYRVYYVHRGEEIVILLCGGNKRTQSADIAKAKKLTKEI